MPDEPRYKRILVKLSGESFSARAGAGAGAGGIEASAVGYLVDQIRPVVEAGIQTAIVVGGGNFIRGRLLTEELGIDRTTADHMGMLATVINGLALRDALADGGMPAKTLSAIPMPALADTFSPTLAIEHMQQGRVVIFTAGTGCTMFTTDTCAALRAAEIRAELLVKATKVDGVFDADPVVNPDAAKYDRLTYQHVLNDQLGVMDMTAISLCMENNIPIVVLELFKPGSLLAASLGRAVGTLVTGADEGA